MKSRLTTALLLISAGVLAGCAAYRAQHGNESSPVHTGSVSSPITERSTVDRQAVDQFARESAGEKQAILLSQLEVYKQELAEQGKYDCCVRPGCNECVLNNGECHCREGVAKGGPCCGECTAAWIEGRGDVPGLDKEEVLKNLGCYRELYEGGPQGMGTDDSSGSIEPKDQDSGHQH